MRNLERSVFRRRYLNEVELDVTNSVGREFHTDMMGFEKKWLHTLILGWDSLSSNLQELTNTDTFKKNVKNSIFQACFWRTNMRCNWSVR